MTDNRSIAMEAFVNATIELAMHYQSFPHNQNECQICIDYREDIKELLEATIKAEKVIDLARCWRCNTVIDSKARYCADCADTISEDRWLEDLDKSNRCGICGEYIATHDAMSCITSDAIGRSYY